jgi:hypothetical protein
MGPLAFSRKCQYWSNAVASSMPAWHGRSYSFMTKKQNGFFKTNKILSSMTNKTMAFLLSVAASLAES